MRRPATVIVAALALVSACSGGSDTPRALPSLTATATPTATVVVVPSAATAHTPFGAAAFVRFWFEALDKAYMSGVPFPSELSSPECQSCKNFAGVADDLARAGHRFSGPSFDNVDAEAPPLAADKAYVTFTCSLPARTEVDREGKPVKNYRAEGSLTLTVLVERTQGAWTVRAMRTEKA